MRDISQSRFRSQLNVARKSSNQWFQSKSKEGNKSQERPKSNVEKKVDNVEKLLKEFTAKLNKCAA